MLRAWSTATCFCSTLLGWIFQVHLQCKKYLITTQAYENGGGTFLIPCIIMLFLIGMPLLFLEVALGQYSNSGPTKVFGRLAPAMKGIGFSMLFVSCIIGVYYPVILAWAIHYFFSGMASEFPFVSSDPDVFGSLKLGNGTTLWNTCCNDELTAQNFPKECKNATVKKKPNLPVFDWEILQ